MLLEEIKKYIEDIVSFKIENILYYIYFKLKSLGSMVGRILGVIEKTQIFFWGNEGAKKDIMDARNIDILVHDN
jgi:hypothetical protein